MSRARGNRTTANIEMTLNTAYSAPAVTGAKLCANRRPELNCQIGNLTRQQASGRPSSHAPIIPNKPPIVISQKPSQLTLRAFLIYLKRTARKPVSVPHLGQKSASPQEREGQRNYVHARRHTVRNSAQRRNSCYLYCCFAFALAVFAVLAFKICSVFFTTNAGKKQIQKPAQNVITPTN